MCGIIKKNSGGINNAGQKGHAIHFGVFQEGN